MILNDRQIAHLAKKQGMIAPYLPQLIRRLEDQRSVISYGSSSFGYDLRLSPKEFKIFRHIPGEVINPKRFNQDFLEPAKLHWDEFGDFFILPGHTYGLGVTVEKLQLPRNITAQFWGKSTYARCGLIANLTPGEAGWAGHLTLEISNNSSADCRVYANEGIVQVAFVEGEPCSISYADRAGKYQDQGEAVTVARV